MDADVWSFGGSEGELPLPRSTETDVTTLKEREIIKLAFSFQEIRRIIIDPSHLEPIISELAFVVLSLSPPFIVMAVPPTPPTPRLMTLITVNAKVAKLWFDMVSIVNTIMLKICKFLWYN